jgi:hypothetical protein
MPYECPKCHRFGLAWDGRAKVLMCYYNTCNHVIRMQPNKQTPTPQEIITAIGNNASEIDHRVSGRFVLE